MATKTKTASRGSKSRKKSEQETVSLPMLGSEGDTCRECSAPLATDQRYCLECGVRRSGPRVDPDHYLNEAGPDAQPDRAVAQSPPKAASEWGAKSVAFGIATLGVMLLLGVLIGRGQGNLQVPVVAGGSAATSATSTTADATDAKNKTASSKGGETVDTGNAAKLDSSTVDALKNASGKNYFELSKKLPDTFATPGKAEKNDPNRKPGGGSSAVTIP